MKPRWQPIIAGAIGMVMALLPAGNASARTDLATTPTSISDEVVAAGDPVTFTRRTGIGTMQVITCWGRADNPHNSTGTPSAVTGKARSGCNAPIEEIQVQAELYRYLDGYGFTVAGIGPTEYQLKSAGPVVSTAYDICQGRPTSYYTFGRHRLVAPPGFEPPSVTLETQSRVVTVDC